MYDTREVRLVNAAGLAKMLSVSKREIERMAADGRLPAPIRMSKRLVRWRLTTIKTWLDGLEGSVTEETRTTDEKAVDKISLT